MAPRASLALSVLSALTVGAGALALPPALEVQDRSLTGSLPKGVAVSPDGATLFVTHFGNANGRSVGVYDVAALRRTTTIDLPGVAVESVVSPDGARLYVSDFLGDAIHVVRLSDRRRIRTISAGHQPKVLALSADGARLFAANWGGATVSEIEIGRAHV